MIAHFGKNFTIEAQQILDLPIRNRKLRKRWKKAKSAFAQLAQFAQLVQLANYFAQRPLLLIDVMYKLIIFNLKWIYFQTVGGKLTKETFGALFYHTMVFKKYLSIAFTNSEQNMFYLANSKSIN